MPPGPPIGEREREILTAIVETFIATGEPNQTVDADHPAKGFPSNVEFGLGADKNLLYVTVDLSLYRIRLNAHGYHPQDEKQ